jgi:O-antigen/teichoic acid export membrane protein
MKEKIINHEFSIFNFKISGKQIFAHPLFSGSAVMIIGSNVGNAIAYLYHLIFGRILGPSRYGELSSILSIMGLLFAAFGFLGLVIVKFVSSGDRKNLKSVYSWFFKIALRFGIGMSVIILLASPFLSNFLHLDLHVVMLLSPIFFFAIVGFVYRSFLQGLMRFTQMVVVTNLDIISRLVFGLLFIYLGLSVFGAVLGLFAAMLVSFVTLRTFLKDIRISTKVNQKFTGSKKVIKYALPVLLASLATNSFFSTDVILVKHFFDSHDAGIYASLSTLGRIIFYGAGPVSSVMFPIIARRHSKKSDYKKVFVLSFLLTLAISLFVVVLYFIFPETSVRLLYGEGFIEASSYLVYFGIFMTIFTLSSLMLNLFLSIEKVGAVYIAAVFAIIQAFGIWIFHDSILTVVKVSIYASSLMLMSLLIYFVKGVKNGREIQEKIN